MTSYFLKKLNTESNCTLLKQFYLQDTLGKNEDKKTNQHHDNFLDNITRIDLSLSSSTMVLGIF